MPDDLMSADQYRILGHTPLVMSIPTQLADTERMDLEYYRPRFVEAQTRIRESGLSLRPLDTLRDPQRIITDGIRKHTKTESGVVLIRTQNFEDASLSLDNCVYVDTPQHEAALKSAVHPGDLLIAIRGYLGKAAIVGPNAPTANINQHIARVAVDPRRADSGYLWAFFSSLTGTALLEQQVTGTVQQGIVLPALRELQIPLPPRPVQEYIGAKVRLAERCRTRAQELWKASQRILAEALGMPLDRGYFERIDPDELQSASYRLVGVKPVVAWVQTDLVEHELGSQYFHPRRANVILKLRSAGVELKRLADLARRRNDRVSAAQVNQVPYYVGLADIDSTMGYFDPVSPQDAGISGTSALFKADDILFSKLRPYLNKVSICPPHVKQASGSTELLVYRTDKAVLPYYVFFVLKSNVGLYQIVDVTTGSTLPRVDPEVVDDALVPSISVEHQQVIDSNVKHALALRHQASQLVREAKADVEALIEGLLDADGIVAGRVRPPTWEEVAPA